MVNICIVLFKTFLFFSKKSEKVLDNKRNKYYIISMNKLNKNYLEDFMRFTRREIKTAIDCFHQNGEVFEEKNNVIINAYFPICEKNQGDLDNHLCRSKIIDMLHYSLNN